MFFPGRTTRHKGSFVIVKQVVYLCTTQSKRAKQLFNNLKKFFNYEFKKR